jgi:O-antigen/teichoic acid export membrane protein
MRVTGIGRGIAWRYASQALSAAGGLFLIGFVLRAVGAKTYGVFALVVTLLGLLSSVDFGLNMSIVRAVARDSASASPQETSETRRDVETAHTLYGVVGVTAVIVSVAAIPILVRLESHKLDAVLGIPLTVGLVGLSVGLSLATSAYTAIPTGRRQFHVSSIASVAGVVTNIIVIVPTLGRLGLPALGLGQLASSLVSVAYSAAWLRKHEPWFRLLPRRASRDEVVRVGTFAVSLLVLSVVGQVIAATDLVVVGIVATATAVGLYKIGNLAPSQIAAWIFLGVDTAFPALAGSRDLAGQEAATRFISQVTGFIDGSALVTMILLRADVVTALLGHQSVLAEEVLVVFCAAAIANISVHGLALLLIARGRQGVFIRLVSVEAGANLVLTIVFAIVIGPVGAALATLVTIVVSNVLAFPFIVRKELKFISSWRIMADSFICIGLGGAVAVLAVLPCLLLSVGWEQLGAGFGGAVLASIAIGLVALGRTGRQTLAGMLRRSDTAADGFADPFPSIP